MNAPALPNGIDYERTGLLLGILVILLAPVRWLWRVFKRRLLVPVFMEALELVLAKRFKLLDDAATNTANCASALSDVAERMELVDEDITILFNRLLGIDRRSWVERRREVKTLDHPDRRRLPPAKDTEA